MGGKKTHARSLPVSFLENHHKNPIPPKKPNMTDKNRQRFASFPGQAARAQVAEAYRRTFGRVPEVVVSPSESGTTEWWLGWVTDDEREAHEKAKTREIILRAKGEIS